MEWPAQEGIGTKRRCGRYEGMGLILVIIVIVLLFGGGGGYYAHRQWGAPGLGGVLGLVLVILLLAWLFGGLGRL